MIGSWTTHGAQDTATSDRVLMDSVQLAGEAGLLLSHICGFWDPQMLGYICASTPFLDNYQKVLEQTVGRLREKMDARTLEKHLVTVERLAIVVGAQVVQSGGGTKQTEELLEFFAARCVAELLSQSSAEDRPLFLRRRAAECCGSVAGLAAHSPLTVPHGDEVAKLTQNLCSLFVVSLSGGEAELLGVQQALCALVLASPATACETVRAVNFMPKLVKVIEGTATKEIKLASVVKSNGAGYGGRSFFCAPRICLVLYGKILFYREKSHLPSPAFCL